MLPSPNYTFVIPSLHDALEICGRIYFPKPSSERKPFVTGIAIFAHPYAPLGGSQDDPVVHSVGAVFLQEGYLLTTFDFRGANGSQGTTSWTGKAEVGDYVSVLTMMIHFINAPDVIHYVRRLQSRSSGCPLFVLGGYSYGSMIASHLPNLKTVLEFVTPLHLDAPEHEILVRSHRVSRSFLEYADTQTSQGYARTCDVETAEPDPLSKGLALGGSKSRPAGRRMSRESYEHRLQSGTPRNSFGKATETLGSTSGDDHHRIEDGVVTLPLRPIIEPEIALLLVSPILGAVSGLLTLFFRPSFKAKSKKRVEDNQDKRNNFPEALVGQPTCAIYGDNDIFTSIKKLRRWVREIESVSGSKFTTYEIGNAGHFWREDGVELKLCSVTQTWLRSLFNSLAQGSEV